MCFQNGITDNLNFFTIFLNIFLAWIFEETSGLSFLPLKNSNVEEIGAKIRQKKIKAQKGSGFSRGNQKEGKELLVVSKFSHLKKGFSLQLLTRKESSEGRKRISKNKSSKEWKKNENVRFLINKIIREIEFLESI